LGAILDPARTIDQGEARKKALPRVSGSAREKVEDTIVIVYFQHQVVKWTPVLGPVD
jgi:hypothetical protein